MLKLSPGHSRTCNLGQNNKEQLTPFHQGNDEGVKEQKRTILTSLKCWGGSPDVPFILSKIVNDSYILGDYNLSLHTSLAINVEIRTPSAR